MSFYIRRRLYALCHVCQKLRPAPDQEGTTFNILKIAHVAEIAAAKTCFLCSLIYTAINTQGYVEPVDDDIYFRTGNGEPFFFMWREKFGPQMEPVEDFQQTGSVGQIRNLGWANAIMQDPNRQATTDQIRGWIRDCDENHVSCKWVDEAGDGPAHLLDLESLGSEKIRLVQGGKGFKYVALSHCWGTTNWCTTTTKNLSCRRKGIRWDELARTFQDAVTITRQIGVRYIWIDSLCIIQDDIKDWETESVKMGSIYRAAYLTIAASLASADDEGFLCPSREREIYKATELQVPFGEHIITNLWVRKTHDFRLHWHNGISEPLAKRAWTMQERVLSSRLLNYSSGITFECTASNKCECGHGLYPDPYYLPLHMIAGLDNKHAFLSLLSKGESRPPIEKMYNLWSAMVTVYTGRKLTKEKDRQIAIAAVSKSLADAYGDEYVAGLWAGDMMKGLAWYTDPRMPWVKSNTSDTEIDPLTGPPSWSWLSAGRLVFRENFEPSSFRVLSMDVKNGGPEDVGPAMGCIKMQAETGTTVIRLSGGGEGFESNEPEISGYELLDRRNTSPGKADIAWFRVDRPVGEGYPWSKNPDTVDPAAGLSVRVVCLHLGRATGYSFSGKPSPYVFLALVERETPEKTYSRIGFIRVTISEEDLQGWLSESHEFVIY